MPILAIVPIVENEPDDDATFRTDLAEAAVEELKADGVEVTGESYEPQRWR